MMDGELDEEDLGNVEVERMPNLDGWEYFKAIDGAEERERWTLAIQHKPGRSSVEYAFWTDIKADPSAAGVLDARQEGDKGWARALGAAIRSSEEGALDNEARSEIVLAVLRRHDPKLQDYEHRLLFAIEPLSDDEEMDDDDDDDDDDNDD
ncbi:MAG TPA: hypothetical protein VK459_20555 [Polyangiaceae bacterium]|nr:hypothetical protein [Polyangiaceae bacterium]